MRTFTVVSSFCVFALTIADQAQGTDEKALYAPVGECPKKPGHGQVYLPDSEDPTIFYQCSGGIPWPKQCPPKTIFDTTLNVCVHDYRTFHVIEEQGTDEKALYAPVGECPKKPGHGQVYLPDSEDPTIFYQCSGGIPWPKQCPPKTIFDTTLNVCVHDYRTFHVIEEQGSDEKALYAPVGECPKKPGHGQVYLPDSEDPTIFYQCSGGIPWPKQCPPKTIFDTTLNVCVHDYRTFHVIEEQGTDEKALYAPVGECPKKPEHGQVYLPDSEDPTIFYQCSGGIPWPKQCPPKTIFDTTLNVCVHDYRTFHVIEEQGSDEKALYAPVGECPKKPGHGQVYLPDSEDPTIFYQCSGGIPWPKQCPPKTIFDTTLNVCVHDYRTL